MEGEMNRIKLADGRYLHVHTKRECVGRNCVIHNPSDHPLNTAPLMWRADRGLMERVCPHGIGHPDPDSLYYLKLILGEYYEGFAFEVHGCDGCCGRNDG